MSALGLIRHLDRHRFQPVVVVERTDGRIADLIRHAGVPVLPSPVAAPLPHGDRIGLGRMARLVPSLLPIVRFLKAEAIDIVHTNDGRTHAAWAIASKLAGRRLVWHHRGTPNAAGLRLLAPLLADRIISVSTFASAGCARARVIHSPFDNELSEDRDAARAMVATELGCRPDTRLVAYCGALIARKRPLLFVDAIAALKRRRPDLDVIGLLFGEPFDVTTQMVIDRAQSAGVAGSIALMGFRSPGPRWLAGCDVLMVPAIDEPFGRTLIEAMLVGTPIVATRSGGNVEALRDGELGELVPPESADALAMATTALLDRAERWQSLSRVAQRDARARFSEQGHADAMMALYDELLPAAAARYFAADGGLCDPR